MLFALQLAVGRGQVHRRANATGEPAVHYAKQVPEFVPQFEPGLWSGAMLPNFARFFGFAMKITTWFSARLTTTQGGEPEWISFTQLYIGFQLTWGHPGPLRVSKQWVDIDNRPYLASLSFETPGTLVSTLSQDDPA